MKRIMPAVHGHPRELEMLGGERERLVGCGGSCWPPSGLCSEVQRGCAQSRRGCRHRNEWSAQRGPDTSTPTSLHSTLMAITARVMGPGQWQNLQKRLGRDKGMTKDQEGFLSALCALHPSGQPSPADCREKPNASCSIKPRVRTTMPSLHRDKESQIGAGTPTLIISICVSSYLLCGTSECR